tara:strand:- start:1202 stop:1624 length:423 start_codon:yes stop_codon:yes gene_type:complete
MNNHKGIPLLKKIMRIKNQITNVYITLKPTNSTLDKFNITISIEQNNFNEVLEKKDVTKLTPLSFFNEVNAIVKALKDKVSEENLIVYANKNFLIRFELMALHASSSSNMKFCRFPNVICLETLKVLKKFNKVEKTPRSS